jgi:4-carboxymuconolactone decarboxylase
VTDQTPRRALDPKTRALVLVAIRTARGDVDGLKDALTELEGAEVPDLWVDELLLQSMLNVGYALSLQAFGVWRAVSPKPELGEPMDHGRWPDWAERGADVCAHVYGRTYHKLLLNLRTLHPALEALVLLDAYGKLIGRPGLDLKRRELCTLAEIAVLNTPRQLHAHLRGALNTGASPEEVEHVLAILEHEVDPAHLEAVRELWADVKSRTIASGRPPTDGAERPETET